VNSSSPVDGPRPPSSSWPTATRASAGRRKALLGTSLSYVLSKIGGRLFLRVIVDLPRETGGARRGVPSRPKADHRYPGVLRAAASRFL